LTSKGGCSRAVHFSHMVSDVLPMGLVFFELGREAKEKEME
jgi:hypothetical protein